MKINAGACTTAIYSFCSPRATSKTLPNRFQFYETEENLRAVHRVNNACSLNERPGREGQNSAVWLEHRKRANPPVCTIKEERK